MENRWLSMSFSVNVNTMGVIPVFNFNKEMTCLFK